MARRGNAAKELAAAADTSSADALVVGALRATGCAIWPARFRPGWRGTPVARSLSCHNAFGCRRSSYGQRYVSDVAGEPSELPDVPTLLCRRRRRDSRRRAARAGQDGRGGRPRHGRRASISRSRRAPAPESRWRTWCRRPGTRPPLTPRSWCPRPRSPCRASSSTATCRGSRKRWSPCSAGRRRSRSSRGAGTTCASTGCRPAPPTTRRTRSSIPAGPPRSGGR